MANERERLAAVARGTMRHLVASVQSVLIGRAQIEAEDEAGIVVITVRSKRWRRWLWLPARRDRQLAHVAAQLVVPVGVLIEIRAG